MRKKYPAASISDPAIPQPPFSGTRRALLKGAGSIGVSLLATGCGGGASLPAEGAAPGPAQGPAGGAPGTGSNAVPAPTDTAPTATLSAAEASVDEGASVTFTLRTSNVAAGTRVGYVVSGVGVTDVGGNDLEGHFVIGNDGSASVTIPVAADSLTEGPETMHMTVAGGVAHFAVRIEDTSVTPLPTYVFSSSASSSEAQGAVVSFRLQTSAVAAGTELPYTLSGVAAADIVGGQLTGKIRIDESGTGVAVVALAASALDNQAEFVRLSLDAAPATHVAQLGGLRALPPAAAAAPGPLSTLAANSARNLGPWTETGGERDDEDPAHRSDYSCVVYDPAGKRILMRGGHHGTNVSTNIRALDLRTLRFSNLFPNTPRREMTLANNDSDVGRWISTNHPWSRHTYNGNVVLDGKLWMMAMQNGHQAIRGVAFPPGYGRSASYDLSAADHRRGWNYSQIKTNWFMMIAACAARDKILVVVRPSSGWAEAWLYDPSTDTRTRLPVGLGTTGWVGDPCVVAYPPNGRYYAFMESGKVWEITLDTANPAAATSAEVATGWPAGTDTVRGYRLVRMDYDPINRVIGGSLISGTYMAFNPTTRSWKQFTPAVETGSRGVPTTAFWCGAFDQDSGCYIAFAADGNCWAYKPPPFGAGTPPPPPPSTGPTTTTLVGTPVAPALGTPVAFTATVSAETSVPTGRVTFREGSATLGTATLVAVPGTRRATATYTHSGFSAGPHSIVAAYAGDATTAASTSAPVMLNIAGVAPNRQPTKTRLASTPNPAPTGSAVSFSATVTRDGPAAPTGTVTFSEGSALLGSAPLRSGTATFTHNGLTAGTHHVVATYGGDATSLGSQSAPLAQVITAASSEPGPLSVELDFGGGQTARFSGGVDIGTFHGEFVHQRCFLATDPAFPDWRVMFRPDVDGKRDEVVVEYGRAVGGTAVNRMTPYTARIFKSGSLIHAVTVPTHWWDARWRWQSAPRPIVRPVSVLRERGWIPPLGTEGLFGRPAYTYAARWDGPMTMPEHISRRMGMAGDHQCIGLLTEAAADFAIRGGTAALQTVMVEGEQCGTWGMHTRFADGTMPDVRGDDLHYKGAKAGATINKPPAIGDHAQYTVLEYAHWYPCANMAWLLTDDPFMLEELQFGVNWRLFYSSWARINLRLGGLIDPSQVRSTAWALRDQFLLACSTPESTPRWLQPRAAWQAQVDDTRDYMLRFVNSNTRVCKVFRIWFRIDMVASWMTAFLNTILGMAVAQGFAEWRPLFEWGMGQHIAMSDKKSGWDVQLATPYYWWPLKVEGYRPAQWPVANDSALDALTHENWGAACDGYAAKVLPGVDRSKWDGETPMLTGIESYMMHLRAALAMGVQLSIPEARQCLNRVNSQIRRKRFSGQARFAVEP